jgi:hypothetical protein
MLHRVAKPEATLTLREQRMIFKGLNCDKRSIHCDHIASLCDHVKDLPFWIVESNDDTRGLSVKLNSIWVVEPLQRG